MARHRKPLNRYDLLNRYARQHGISLETARQIHGVTDILELINIVEAQEGQRGGARRSFARSLPTTTARGETR